MPRIQRCVATSVVGVLVGVIGTACTGSNDAAPPPAPPTTVSSPTGTTGPTGGPTGSTPTPDGPTKIPRRFDPKNFTRSLTDVNEFVPLVPGLQTVSKGFVTVGGRRLPHVKVTTVTDVTKTINGVRAILILDQDFDAGQLSEQAVDYLAEDEGGNVWYLGSYTEVYESGQFLNAEDAWLAGVNGAAPGLYMPGRPKPGTPAYYQVKIPGGEQSTAVVSKINQKKCVPFKCYKGVLVVEEQGSENKYWAPGVGGILTEPILGAAQEIEELINVKELSGKALAELSKEVLRLDRSAAGRVPSVFGRSKAAKRGV